MSWFFVEKWNFHVFWNSVLLWFATTFQFWTRVLSIWSLIGWSYCRSRFWTNQIVCYIYGRFLSSRKNWKKPEKAASFHQNVNEIVSSWLWLVKNLISWLLFDESQQTWLLDWELLTKTKTAARGRKAKSVFTGIPSKFDKLVKLKNQVNPNWNHPTYQTEVEIVLK